MDRKEFLSLVGGGGAAVLLVGCLGGCKGQDDVTGPTNIDFTLDLNAAANLPLKTNGGYVYQSGVIVARTTSGNYVAVGSTCTHQGGTVAYDATANRFHCPIHGSDFSTDGGVVTGPASKPLSVFKTTLTGTSLRVYS